MDKVSVRRDSPPPHIPVFRPKQPLSDERAFRKRFYASAAWLRIRSRVLAERPLCPKCQDMGRIEPATDVHHLKPLATHPHLALDFDNLEGLCKMHHSRETYHEQRPKS